MDEYIKNLQEGRIEENFVLHEKQDKTAMAKEFILLALRTIQGCNLEEFEEKFGYELKKGFKQELAKLEGEGLIEVGDEWIRLSSKGLDLANMVWEEFV